ncbi:hypothetical protein V1512DRAFT_34455 [Lipomyces arxii]|uniref:uncharacterized protein n=1 Tax=Lipomyces arxii TaxID=56418 RepID=UPI0034CFEFA1
MLRIRPDPCTYLAVRRLSLLCSGWGVVLCGGCCASAVGCCVLVGGLCCVWGFVCWVCVCWVCVCWAFLLGYWGWAACTNIAARSLLDLVLYRGLLVSALLFRYICTGKHMCLFIVLY